MCAYCTCVKTTQAAKRIILVSGEKKKKKKQKMKKEEKDLKDITGNVYVWGRGAK